MDRVELDQWKGREVARLLALVETERRYYQEIVASFPIGAVIVARSGAVVFANRAFRRLAGVRPGELQSKTLDQVIASPRLGAAVEETLRTSTPHPNIPIELAGYEFQASVIPLHGWEDDPESEALIALEGAGTLSALAPPADSSDWPALLWTMHPETQQYLTIDGAREHLLGYSAEHWTSTPDFWREHVHGDDRAAISQFYRTALRQGGEFGCEYRAMTASGKPVWRRDVFRVTLDHEGAPVRVSGVTIDAGARRRAEADNLQFNRFEALTALSRRLSHDFNNSLMVVTGYAEELLAHLPESDARRADVQSIVSAAESMAGVAGELGGFSRRQSSPAVATDLSGVLTAAASRIRSELGATLVLRQPQHRLEAYADPIQLEAMLIAIARSLRDKDDPHMIVAAGEVGVDEQSNLAHALHPGRYVEIALRGPFASEVPRAAFETLISGKDPHSSDITRAYTVAREWGGTMYALRTDHTSEVHLLLPAVVAEPAEPRSPKPAAKVAEPVATAAPEPVEPAPVTIMVVEDEKGIRGLIQKILKREGYQVLVASNSDEADEAAAASPHPIRLVIADLNVSGRDGRAIADRLSGRYPDLRVLYISGYADDPEATTRAVGSAPFLQKPFTLAALVKKVREIAAPENARSATAAA
ncbi:MAG: PAS domain-containing protein [Acidobacteria bacterium]|nr:PAS domain-containing protein [Acidobacteriota bacterium]